MKEKFESRKLTGKIKVACKYEDGSVRYWDTDKQTVIVHIKYIVEEYQRQGYVLTLRQLHYQLVTRNWIVNHVSAYSKLGDILDDCRYSGIIDWDAIEDRGRIPHLPYYNDDANEAMLDTIKHFRIDRQEKQKNCVELWTEKDALSGILKRTTHKYHVRLVVNKGYTSSSAIYSAYNRIVEALIRGQKFTILYFGDHDPSGLDMVRDINDRLLFMLTNGNRFFDNDELYEKLQNWWLANKYSLYDLMDNEYTSEDLVRLVNPHRELSYAEEEKLHKAWDAGRVKMYLAEHDLFHVIPIGLTKEQIIKYNLPPNPTKLTDSRAKDYIRKHGKTCWEVDALKPQILTNIVETNILQQIDETIYQAALEREQSELEILKSFLNK